MTPTNLRPETILPHRDRMLLIDEILEVNDHGAVTRSVVRERWPYCEGRSVLSLVLIELVAQTAGIHNGWIREKLHGPQSDKKGWIVGIRQARLLVDAIPLHTSIVTRAENQMEFEGFRDVYGKVEIENKLVAEITLQLLRADPIP
jgi:predicted hotdog family 3-hydroxylacyl-ACP dehydratase